MLLILRLVLIMAVVGFVRCVPRCATDESCLPCPDLKFCKPSCGDVVGVKQCFCECKHPCAQNSDCPSVPAIAGRSPECRDDGCNAYFGGSNATKCPGEQYPCLTKSGTAKGIYFYKKCTTNADCEMGWKGCKADCQPICYISYKGNRFCACVCAGRIKQCPGTVSCPRCTYKTECEPSCQQVDGVKTCVCQCYYPCKGTVCPTSPIRGINTTRSSSSGTSGCYLLYANEGKGCPAIDYGCELFEKYSGGEFEVVKGIFFYKKCEMDSECAAILTKCAELVGEGCEPKCNVIKNGKKFCTCLCPGTYF